MRQSQGKKKKSFLHPLTFSIGLLSKQEGRNPWSDNPLSLSLTHTHTLSLSLSLSHTHTQTQSHTHTRTHSSSRRSQRSPQLRSIETLKLYFFFSRSGAADVDEITSIASKWRVRQENHTLDLVSVVSKCCDNKVRIKKTCFFYPAFVIKTSKLSSSMLYKSTYVKQIR